MAKRTRNIARGMAFAAIFAWMIANPVYRQVAGGKNPHFRAWVMFSGIGLGGIDARFHVRHDDGSLEEVDRWEHTHKKAPARGTKRRIGKRDALDQEIARLCRALGPSADLRVSARQAKRRGWVWIHEQEVNACESVSKTSQRRHR